MAKTTSVNPTPQVVEEWKKRGETQRIMREVEAKGKQGLLPPVDTGTDLDGDLVGGEQLDEAAIEMMKATPKPEPVFRKIMPDKKPSPSQGEHKG
jgi:hypothetical protein